MNYVRVNKCHIKQEVVAVCCSTTIGLYVIERDANFIFLLSRKLTALKKKILRVFDVWLNVLCNNLFIFDFSFFKWWKENLYAELFV